jgi:anti-sigma factor (TIGR02949 family)
MTSLSTTSEMLDCDDVMHRLWEYLDGELSPDRMTAMRRHLELCRNCHPHEAYERAFLDAVSRARREHPDLPGLRGRVLERLRDAGFAAR